MHQQQLLELIGHGLMISLLASLFVFSNELHLKFQQVGVSQPILPGDEKSMILDLCHIKGESWLFFFFKITFFPNSFERRLKK